MVKKPYVDLTLRGDKTIELRLTNGTTLELGCPLPGDKLFLKIRPGPVCATATVAQVRHRPNLTPAVPLSGTGTR